MKPIVIKNPLNQLKQNDIAALFGVTDRTIRNWIAEGLTGNGEGRAVTYDWPTVLAWRDDRISGAKAGPDLTDRERKLRAEADLAEMEAAKMAGDLLDAQDVGREWGGFLSRLKVNLDGLPNRAAQGIEQGMILAEIEAVIRRELNSIRRDLVAAAEAAADRDGAA
jgi:phage terminase Nu1 subunit (DNA packaging protein)